GAGDGGAEEAPGQEIGPAQAPPRIPRTASGATMSAVLRTPEAHGCCPESGGRHCCSPGWRPRNPGRGQGGRPCSRPPHPRPVAPVADAHLGTKRATGFPWTPQSSTREAHVKTFDDVSTYRLQIDAHHCHPSPDEIDRLTADVNEMASQVEAFPVSDFHVLI